jgi:hypothetical protein
VTLALELLGALSTAALIRAMGARSRSLLPALTCVAIVVGAISFWRGVWPEVRALVSLHTYDERLTPAQAFASPGSEYGAREGFLAWAADRLPPRARVFLACAQPTPCSNALANWITYRLGPRVFTDFAVQAQWVLFYGTPTSALVLRRPTRVLTYAPGFAIGRLAR